MNFKNLLAVHSVQDHIDSLEPVVSLSRHYEAHLEVQVLNLVSPVAAMTFMEDPYYDWSMNFTEVLKENNQRASDVRDWLGDSGLSFEVNSVCQQLGLIDDDIAESALYADLVTFIRGRESLVSGMMAKALKGAIFDASKPALILAGPVTGTEQPFSQITIAWDASPGSMRAISAALPFLRVAKNVELAIVTDEEDLSIHQVRTKKVTQWLKRSGVSTELIVIHREDRAVSDMFLNYVNDNDHDLIVMGAYGHARLAEKLFSGVTHQVLANAAKTLLIAH